MDAREEKQKKNERARKTKAREKEIEEERKMRESLKGLARGITFSFSNALKPLALNFVIKRRTLLSSNEPHRTLNSF